MMIRLAAVVAALLTGLTPGAGGAELDSTNQAPTTANYRSIRSEVETLRGKKFLHEVPVAPISEEELRKMCDQELEKQYPGEKLAYYQELLAWLDIVPPQTDLKEAYAKFMVDQVAGLYDSDTKSMYIPSFSTGATNAVKAHEKKVEKFSPSIDDIVLAHEFTHALEDQYWPMDDPKDREEQASTDRGTAHSFLLEGSATRAMIEAIPAQSAQGRAGPYFFLWNLLHSRLGEFGLRQALDGAWKGSDTAVAGVPETLSRMEVVPYSFGYVFCTEVMRRWGLDGLDYVYDHPPVSSEQIMHPKKCWEWRDFPVQVQLPETLPGGWKQVSHDSAGEAGMAIWLGCELKNANRGLQLASGWDGDRAALFERPNGKHLLVWASAWDSSRAAARYASGCVEAKRVAHEARVATNTVVANRRATEASSIHWQRPDGHQGLIVRHGKRIILLETDDPESLVQADAISAAIVFAEPPEDAARAAANDPFHRFNPFLSWQRDGDYAVTRSLAGLLSRHDRNSIGAADSCLLGLAGGSRRTASFNEWELGGGWLARHESEARRGVTKTTILPWGLLTSYSSTRLPQSPDRILTRWSLLWGLGASVTASGSQRKVAHVLPFGLFYQRATAPGQTSMHVLGTGWFRKKLNKDSDVTATRFRLLGFRVWSTRAK